MIHEVNFTFTTDEARNHVEELTGEMYVDAGFQDLDSSLRETIQELTNETSATLHLMVSHLVAGAVLVDVLYKHVKWIPVLESDDDEPVELPPVSDDVVNLDELLVLDIDSYMVTEYHPERDAQGEPTMVVMLIDVKGLGDVQLGIRLKSTKAVNELIAALQRHRDSVWPKA